MKSNLNWFEMFVACWLTRRVVKQGLHEERITSLLMVLRAQTKAEFTEDNDATITHFLRGCFDDAVGAKDPLEEYN